MLEQYNFFPHLGKLLCIISIICLVACESDINVKVASDVTQSAANDMVLLLGMNGIKVNKTTLKDGNYDLFVLHKDQLDALKLLKANGKPLKSFVSLGDVFKKDSFISSPLEEQGRFLYALDQEISSMLSQIDGVTVAITKVSLPSPTDSLWQNEVINPSAAVLIKYKYGYRVDLYANRIKKLVSDAVPGLTPDNVTVVTLVEK